MAPSCSRDEANFEHVYRIQAPIDKVLAYFGPDDDHGQRGAPRQRCAIYKRASVRGAEVNPTKVDVYRFIEVGNSLTRVSVTEFPPPPKHIPSADRTKAAATAVVPHARLIRAMPLRARGTPQTCTAPRLR